MKTIDEIIDIMHSSESSDSAVLWAGAKFDALSKEEVQSLYQRGKISLEELENHPAFEEPPGDLCPDHLEKPRDFDPFGQTGFAHLWLQYD